MAFDDASAQLQLDLRTAVQAALNSRRPLLHHLNADTSWLLQLPRPATAARRGGRRYFNILIDPWLAGGQTDVASWFSYQSHASQSAVTSIAGVEELAHEVEIMAAGLRRRQGWFSSEEPGSVGRESFLDAVAISHPFTDHCHEDTLLELHPDVPVFAVDDAVSLIKGWKHFRTVVPMQSFGVNGNNDWRLASQPPLPEWISISRLLQKDDMLNFHSAVMIAFKNQPTCLRSELPEMETDNAQDSHSTDAAEALIYTPHGIHSGDLHLIPSADPPIRTLAFLHGLHNVRIGSTTGRLAHQLNTGAHNGLKAQRILNAKYWIGTHDEVKDGSGLVSWFLKRDVISLPDALRKERQALRDAGLREDEVEAFNGVNWVELGNGESRVLV